MEALEFWAIFTPDADLNQDFFRGLRMSEINLTVRDGSNREVYTGKVKIGSGFLKVHILGGVMKKRTLKIPIYRFQREFYIPFGGV